MSKADDKYRYLNQAKIFSHDGVFYIDDMNVDEWTEAAFAYCSSINAPLTLKELDEYYGLANTLNKIFVTSTYGNIDIFRAWLELFLTNLESAIFLKVWKTTEGDEKAKWKVVTPLIEAFRKKYK